MFNNTVSIIICISYFQTHSHFSLMQIFNFIRRRENRVKLLVYDHLVIIDQLLSHSLHQVISSSEHSREWTEVFELGSKFIEWLFDPELTWSTWIST